VPPTRPTAGANRIRTRPIASARISSGKNLADSQISPSCGSRMREKNTPTSTRPGCVHRGPPLTNAQPVNASPSPDRI